MFTSVIHDLRYALRTLLRNPGFAVVSVLALALGIGANSAIFTVVNALLLQRPDFPNPDQLTIVRERNLKAGFPQFSVSPGNYLDYRDHNRSFTGIAAFTGAGFNLSAGGEPERLRGVVVTTDFFRVLGRQPILGRPFTEAEGQFEAPHVAIISYGLWQRQFAGSHDVVGRTLKLNGQPYTVVGVMAADFIFPGRSEIWAPLTMNEANWRQRGGHYLTGIGRLKAGVTLDSALSDLDAIAARAERQNPASNTGWDARLQSLQDAQVGRVRPAVLTLGAAVGFVLLIACVNLANLLLSRSTGRRREIGIRNSLGASRSRLIRQLLTESLLLAGLGASAGLALAWLSTRLISKMTDILPRAAQVSLDWRAIAFTGATAMLTGILFGLAPAIQMAGRNLADALREGGRGNAIGFRRNRLRSLLVIGEVALSLVLLVGAGLLMRSFYRLQSVEPGFDSHGVLVFRTNLPDAQYKTDESQAAFYRRALDQIRALPGVSAAGAAQIFPLSGDEVLTFEQIGKPPVPAGHEPSAMYYAATPGFLAALRIPIKAGRDFDSHDSAAGAPVAVISEEMARRFYRNENPIGQFIRMGNGSKAARIVGIAGNIRDEQLETAGMPAVYEPADQVPSSEMYFGVRAAGDPMALSAPVRAIIRQIDPELPIDEVGTFDKLVEDSLSQRHLAMVLMAIFAAVALILAMVGIYGVLSYAVTQATQEIGIRMALGARRGNILAMVFQYAGVLLASGIVIGAVGAWASVRLLASQLYQVPPTDGVTYVMVASALLVSGLVACAVPAARAMRVDPMVSLRNE